MKTNRINTIHWLLAVMLATVTIGLAGGAIGLAKISPESKECIDCHKKDNPGLYEQWGSSLHFRGAIRAGSRSRIPHDIEFPPALSLVRPLHPHLRTTGRTAPRRATR